MKRTLEPAIAEALTEKIVLLTGPRQAGKTTLAKALNPHFDYFNYDAVEDRLALAEKSWDRTKKLVVFDELHKMPEWKSWIKGVYDKEGVSPQLLVTGSAQLDTWRKVGDSLAGRYFQYRLLPLDLREVAQQEPGIPPQEIFERLWHCGGFPEPFFKGTVQYYRRWRRSHLDVILRQDLLDLQSVRDIQSIEMLVKLLKMRVGSSVSYANLARDLEKDIHTVKRWLQLLENLYVIFRVTPYHHNIARALLKEPKYYFFDGGQVEGDDGARLENLVALALFKALRLMEDTLGLEGGLHYLRTKEGKELDFLVCVDGQPVHLIEVKMSDGNMAPGFAHFLPSFPSVRSTQLVLRLAREKTFPNGVAIRSLIPWLVNLDFGDEV